MILSGDPMPDYRTTGGRKSSPRSSKRNTKLARAFLFALGAASLPAVYGQATGGSFCANSLCVHANVRDGKVYYQLQSTYGFSELGWMAVGFGTGMIGSPMVVTWPNNDGTITISHRQATAHAMPTVVPNPTHRATLEWGYSQLASNMTTITFSYPLPADLANVQMIYAYSLTRPPSSAVDARMVQHNAANPFVLDLTQSSDPLITGTLSTPSSTATTGAYGTQTSPMSTSTSSSSNAMPLSAYQRKLVTHGILASIGFLIFLPIGVLIPRYTRTIPALQSKWFTAHWFVQFVVSGPIIFAAWALGYQSVDSIGDRHFDDKHKRVGLALLILYLFQMCLGAFIHFVKPKPKAAPNFKSESQGVLVPSSSSGGFKRPPQNYFHAIVGLAIIGLALYNVHEGYHNEFPEVSGIEGTKELKMVNAWWISWVVILPCLYILGLSLLPRQYKKERQSVQPTTPGRA